MRDPIPQRDSVFDARCRAVLASRPGLVERFCWWLPKRIDKVWRKTIRLQRTRFWRIPYAISFASNYVANCAVRRCMDRLDRVTSEC